MPSAEQLVGGASRTRLRAAGVAAGGGVLSLLVALGLVVLGVPLQPARAADTSVQVDDAVFAWSMSDQTNALSHNPAAINFLAAGVADPGRGGTTLRERSWRATDGEVTVQKQASDGSWETATWAGLRTDAAGDRIGVYGPFSGHRVQVTDGTGVLDPAADDADVQWKGTWTVVYYGGNTVFTMSEPRMEVRGGRGTLSAVIGGWTSDRNDPTAWDSVPPRRVTVVTLQDVDVTRTGFRVTPDYRGVEVDGSVPQLRSGEDWGSFHPDFVRALEPMGTDQFWYSTGLQSDWTKLPTPITVGLAGQPTQPTQPSAPTSAPTTGPTTAPTGGPTTGPTPSATPSPTAGPTEEPTQTPTGRPSTGPTDDGNDLRVDDAVFAWSMSDQTNALSHNPGAINFLSAGVANPGKGGATLRERDWRARDGDVTIQKQGADGSWRPATWAGLRTDATGVKIGVYGPFSGHRVRVTGGSGVVDPVAEDADVRWKGTWTVVYYGGNTVFTLTDPRIELRDGKGKLTALAGGWGSDRDDATAWDKVPSRRVTVVQLTGVDVTEDGFVVTPDYERVRVDGTVTQRRTGEKWGSFHPELVDFLAPMGTDQFWYSTGLQSDWTKLPTPVAVSWRGAEPVVSPSPRPSTSTAPKPSNTVVARPTPSTPTSGPRPDAPLAAPPLLTAPLPADVPLAAAPVAGRQRGGTLGAPVQVTAVASSSTVRAAAPWTAGGVLLIAAALLLVLPVGRRGPL